MQPPSVSLRQRRCPQAGTRLREKRPACLGGGFALGEAFMSHMGLPEHIFLGQGVGSLGYELVLDNVHRFSRTTHRGNDAFGDRAIGSNRDKGIPVVHGYTLDAHITFELSGAPTPPLVLRQGNTDRRKKQLATVARPLERGVMLPVRPHTDRGEAAKCLVRNFWPLTSR